MALIWMLSNRTQMAFVVLVLFILKSIGVCSGLGNTPFCFFLTSPTWCHSMHGRETREVLHCDQNFKKEKKNWK
jgi:hypothetical protein